MDNCKVIGFYKVTSVKDGTHLVLQNLQGIDDKGHENLPEGTRVGGAVFVGPAANTCAIDIGARRCRVERVHVTDSGTPIYEGALGIALAHCDTHAGEPFYLGDGNVIRDCIIDNLWGSAGTCISIVSNNPDTGNIGVFISAVVENNVIHSNGMHIGLGSYGTRDAIWSKNTVSNCRVGWFTDVGYNEDAQIINNTFVDDGEGIQLGGGFENGWRRFNISGNHILVPQGGTGMLLNGQVHQCVVSGNQIMGSDGTTKGIGVNVNAANTEGNIYSNNVISGVLTNSMPPSTGTGIGNVTLSGGPIKGE
jgi:hypothetical protein